MISIGGGCHITFYYSTRERQVFILKLLNNLYESKTKKDVDVGCSRRCCCGTTMASIKTLISNK